MTGITGNLYNKCPKWLVEQKCSSSDYFNVISGFTSNSRAPGGPVTLTNEVRLSVNLRRETLTQLNKQQGKSNKQECTSVGCVPLVSQTMYRGRGCVRLWVWWVSTSWLRECLPLGPHTPCHHTPVSPHPLSPHTPFNHTHIPDPEADIPL